MAFETFTGRSTPASAKIPRVAIQKRGTFSLNHAAFTAMGEPGFIEFMYDSERQLIAIRPVAETVHHAYPVRKQPGSRSYVIAGNAFCAHYGILTEFTRAFHPRVNSEKQVLVIDLEKGEKIITKRSRKQSTKKDEPQKGQTLNHSHSDDDLPF